MIAFRRMVVDDVQDHFDAGGVQRLHHRLELAQRAGGGVAHVGREEADRVVAPVVAQPVLDQPLVVDQRMDRHQLDGGDAEPAQVLEHRRGRKAGIGAAKLRRDVRCTLGVALDVQLVDHRVLPGRARRTIVAPRERRIDDLALGHSGRAVAGVERQVLAARADAVAELRVAPAQLTLRCCARTDRAGACAH